VPLALSWRGVAAIPFAAELARVRSWLHDDRSRAQARRAAPLAVFLIALAPRWWFVGQHPLDWYLVSNMAFYDARADHVLSGELSIRDTFTPVGYPALLALVYAWFGKSYALVGHAQAVLGAATCALTHGITLRVTRSARASFVAGVLLALYLPLVVYTGFLLTETLFAFLLALFVCLLGSAVDRPGIGRAAFAGLVLGAGTAVRPNLALAFPLLAAYALYLGRSRALAPRAWRAPLWAIGFALPVVAVVVADNSRIAGRPAGLATNGGVNFFLGHCECRAVTFPRGTGVGEVSGHQNRQRYTEVIASPRAPYDERYFYGETLRRIAERPALIVRALVNVGDGLVLTGLGEWPAQPYYPGWMGHEDELRAFGRGFAWLGIVPAFASATWLAIRRRLPAATEGTRVLLLALLASLLATLYLYLGDPRLRVPFDPLLMALAVDAWWRAGRAVWARARAQWLSPRAASDRSSHARQVAAHAGSRACAVPAQ
jgi:4-amino-4-deoxy-L-arabinose transferase-like glycosyltransferase